MAGLAQDPQRDARELAIGARGRSRRAGKGPLEALGKVENMVSVDNVEDFVWQVQGGGPSDRLLSNGAWPHDDVCVGRQ